MTFPFEATPAMVKAALDLVWEESETYDYLVCRLWSAMAAAATDRSSAARELALEEIIVLCRDYGEDSQPDSEYRLACNDIIEAIQERRALSSPNHADAGKLVEGDDGRPCSMDEFMAALFNEKVDEFDVSEAAASWLHGDWKDALSYLTDVPAHWRPLPSAPSQEVAGS